MSVLRGTWLPLSAVKSVHFTGDLPAADRFLGVEILTDEFNSEGILYRDEGLILKSAHAQISPGDLVCVFVAGEVLVRRYDPARYRNTEIIGKITRTWRDYR